MALYAAIDLHSTNHVLAVIDEQDRLLLRQRLSNDLATTLRELEPFRDEVTAVVVESTYNWYWLVDGLMAHGYPVKLANTAAIPQYAGLKHGDDDSDALHLARLLRLGILPEGHIYPRRERSLRDLLRRRFQLVRQAVGVLQSVQSTWARVTGRSLSGSAFKRLSAEDLEASLDDATVRLSVTTQLTVWHAIEAELGNIERWLRHHVSDQAGLKRLCSVPGIGPILSLTILLETGAIGRFARVGDYASYCRLVKSERFSNGKKKGEGNAKCGNRYLCWAYVEAANFAVRHDARVKRWFQRKSAKRHRVLAIKALASKIARACYHMLREGTDFDCARAFA